MIILIVDFHGTMIASIMYDLYRDENMIIDEVLFRNRVLVSLKKYLNKFTGTYGKMVVSCDSGRSWRHDYYPYYKAARKKNKADSPFDWEAIHSYMNMIKKEIKEYTDYPVVEVPKAESDDIIATLIETSKDKNNIIVSRDKDFGQLLGPNVKQYDPIKDEYIEIANPKQFLFEQIIRGDLADGVPNILSDDDVFVNEGKRQKSIFQKKVDELWLEPSKIEEFANFKRNSMLIDLDNIPKNIRENILEEYKSQLNKEDNLLEYFSKYKLGHMLQFYQEFTQ
jgi:5'-3' exonuclease